jgi:integrase/recombinase XerD
MAVQLTSKTPLSLAVEAFLERLQEEGRADLTLRSYRSDLSALCRSIGPSTRIEALNARAERHVRDLPLAARSWNRHLGTVRRFCDFLVSRQALKANPMRRVEQAQVRDDGAAAPEAKGLATLLARIERPRDRVLVALLMDTGLRIGEALALAVRDLRPDASSVKVLQGRARTVRLGRTMRTMLIGYLRDRNPEAEEPLFATDAGRALSYAGAHRVFRRYARGTGITLRDLRAKAVASAFAHGASLLDVQTMLGHRHVASTARYQGLANAKNTT